MKETKQDKNVERERENFYKKICFFNFIENIFNFGKRYLSHV